MTKERFWSEDYSAGYYTEIIDNNKELTDVPNPKKNLLINEVVDVLNKLNDEKEQLAKENKKLQERNNRQAKHINHLSIMNWRRF